MPACWHRILPGHPFGSANTHTRPRIPDLRSFANPK